MKIAIAGYGMEGKANYTYFSGRGHDITIVDERTDVEGLPEGVPTILGADAFAQLDDFDMVVRTASLAPSKIHTNGSIWSATSEFFEQSPAPIIGVTGTKGKGTTSSLIASILRATGRTVHLVGNIGTPALDELGGISPDDVVVFELSSFQLWDLQKSPHVAVVLTIEPDHLNTHDGMDDYVSAKANIVRHQTSADICIYHPANTYSSHIATLTGAGHVERYGIPDDGSVYVADDWFRQAEHNICSVDALQLIGAHNIENACAAIAVAKQLEVTDEQIEQGLRDFQGLPYRLEFVRELDGVRYFNDSFSAAPSATVAAVRSFSDPEIIILGGTDKGADFTELAQTIQAAPNIKRLIIIGEIRNALAAYLTEHGVTTDITVTDVRTMGEIVALARSSAAAGDVVVLSPACASFDMFKNFYDRGDQFRSVVQAL